MHPSVEFHPGAGHSARVKFGAVEIVVPFSVTVTEVAPEDHH